MYLPPPVEFSITLELLSRLNRPVEPPMLRRLVHAAYAGTLPILRNENDDPVGFVCWAGANKDSVRVAEKFNRIPSLPWEFKEGKIALLLEVFFIAPFGQEARVAFRRFLAARRAIYYIKRERKRLLIRTSNGFRFTQVN